MLNNLNRDDNSYGTPYNVEYKWGNGKYHTFSGILENVDSDAFWFRVNGAISKISQDRVIWMLPNVKKGGFEMKKVLKEFSNEWVSEIVRVGASVFGDCIQVASDTHPCGWDVLSFENVTPESVLNYTFELRDITGHIYYEHEFEGLTLLQILKDKGRKWGFEGID